MNNNLKQLLDLQDLDESIRKKERKIDRFEGRVEKLGEEIKQIKGKEEKRKEHLKSLKEESREKNARVNELQEQIDHYQERLDEGIISFKETEALEEKIQHSTERMENLEDEAIDVMMEIDRTESKREEQKSRAKSNIEKKEARIADLEDEKSELKRELKELAKERKDLKGKTPEKLIEQYERLQASTNKPIVQVKNGVCQGCQMSVSKNTVKKARNGQGIVTCENCSRILYVQ